MANDMDTSLCNVCNNTGTKSSATALCRDCNMAYCAECLQEHNELNFTKGHDTIIHSREQNSSSDSSEVEVDVNHNHVPSSSRQAMTELGVLVGNNEHSHKDSLEMKAKAIMSTPACCHIHSGCVLKWYCRSCKTNICDKCKSDKHFTHKIKNLKTTAAERKRVLRQMNERLQKKKPRMETYRDKLQQYQQELINNKKFVNSKLLQRRNDLKKLVDRWYDSLWLKLETEYSKEESYLQQQLNDLNGNLIQMHDTTDTVNTVLTYSREADLVQLSKALNKSLADLNSYKLKTMAKMNVVFSAGTLVQQDHFGTVNCFRTPPDQQSSSMEVLSKAEFMFSFETRLPDEDSDLCATGLSICPGDKMVVADIGTDQVGIFSPKGRRFKSLNIMPDDQPTTAAALHNGNTAVVCKNEVQVFNSRGELSHTLNQELESPRGICVNNNGDILVTECNDTGNFVHVFDAKSYALKLTVKSKQNTRCTYSDDDSGNCSYLMNYADDDRDLFTKPLYVTTNKKNEIIISDYVQHKILVFCEHGTLQHEFGQAGIAPGHLYRPAGLCTDKYGNIIVADSGNNRVQVFSSCGQYLGVIVDEESHSIELPMDVSVKSDGQLLVLLSNGDVCTYKYLYAM